MTEATNQIVLDTETTGLDPNQGHRVIEIGCIKLLNRKFVSDDYHQYIKPDRDIDAGAVNVHGLTTDFLSDKPRFRHIIEEFIEYVRGAELIIHNAKFDVGFLNHEFGLAGKKYGKITDYCTVLDTLTMARQMHPGQKNNLDALCKRYGIDNTHRELHGGLLDAKILAYVYLAMTSGQDSFAFLQTNSGVGGAEAIAVTREADQKFVVITADKKEVAAHDAIMAKLQS